MDHCQSCNFWQTKMLRVVRDRWKVSYGTLLSLCLKWSTMKKSQNETEKWWLFIDFQVFLLPTVHKRYAWTYLGAHSSHSKIGVISNLGNFKILKNACFCIISQPFLQISLRFKNRVILREKSYIWCEFEVKIWSQTTSMVKKPNFSHVWFNTESPI